MLTRLILCIALLVVVAPFATAYAYPTWARSVGLDVWSLPALREEFEASAEQSRELEAEGDDVLRRIEVKDAIIASLIHGRASLEETAGQFAVLNEGNLVFVSVIDHSFPGSTFEEKMARNVIEFAIPRLSGYPAWYRLAVLSRLELELDRLITESSRHATQE